MGVTSSAYALEPVEFTLSNGLKVVLVPNRSSHVVLVVRVNAGFLDERPDADPAKDETGVSHELEHALFRGTASLPDKDTFVAALNTIGAQYNASTNFERTNYFIIAPGQNAGKAIEIQAEMFHSPLLTTANFASEAHPVSEELRRNLTNPYFTLYEFSLALHGETERMRHLMASTAETTLGHSADVIRGFFRRYYSANNMTLAIVGNVGDDLDALKAKLEATYGRIPTFQVAPPVQVTVPSAQPALRLFRVKTPATNTNLLNIGFALPETGGVTEAAVTYLSMYFERRGAGSLFEELYEQGLIRSIGVTTERYRELRMVRLVVDMTPQGESQMERVLEHIAAAIGSVRAHGIPENVLNEMKETYRRTVLERTGLLNIAESLSDAVHEGGAELLSEGFQNFFEVKGGDIQALAQKLDPAAMQLTLLTPNVSAQAQPQHGVRVEAQDLSALTARLTAAAQASTLAPDTEENPFLPQEGARLLRMRGVALAVAQDESAGGIEGVFHFSLARIPLTPEERIAVTLAMMAFELDPANERLIKQAADAGISLDFGLNLDERLFSISVDGSSTASVRALHMLLERLRTYVPTDAAFARAKRSYIDRVRSAPATEVTRAALSQGARFSARGTQTQGGRLLINSQAQTQQLVAQAQAASADVGRRFFDTGRKRWGVTGALKGDWSDSDLRVTVAMMAPESARRPDPRVHSSALPAGTRPQLVIRASEHDRQGVARFFPVPVQEYSPAYWAFQMFAQVVDKRLDEVVRTEMGLAYAVTAGFTTFTSGGGALYMAADSSQAAQRLAMAYTVVMEDLLTNGITNEEFVWARTQVAGQFMRMVQSTEGLYAQAFEGLEPNKIGLYLKVLNGDRLMQVIRRYLPAEGRAQLDSAVVGESDPSCEDLLRPAS